MESLIILILALLLDAVFGEPRNRFHPVAWLGNFINFQLKFNPRVRKISQLCFGIIVVMLTVLSVTAALLILTYEVHNLNIYAGTVLSAYILKNTFSLRGLWQALDRVKIMLEDSNLLQARMDIKALVSRDTSILSAKQIMSAAIESCAENLCDSFIAPVLYYAIFGLPGAVIYRIINTFDAMIGYHGQWEYTGKFAARLDDVANYIPARISAALIVIATALLGKDVKNSFKIMLFDHNKTESPNAGCTMSAMAGSLGIELHKTGCYRLGHHIRDLDIPVIVESQYILVTAASFWIAIIITIEAVCCVAL